MQICMQDCGPNHPLVFSPLRCVLIILAFLLSIGWNAGLALRAEIRVAAWVAPDDNITGYKREHYSTWHHVSCPDWNDNYEGSSQPVTCSVSWFSRPGMIITLIGYLTAIAAGCVWLCKCRVYKRSSNICSTLQKPIASLVFTGGVLLLVGWIVVLTDTSLKDLIPADALPLPDGSPAQEYMHKSRWWYGMLCGPFFWMLGALIWFFRADGAAVHQELDSEMGPSSTVDLGEEDKATDRAA